MIQHPSAPPPPPPPPQVRKGIQLPEDCSRPDSMSTTTPTHFPPPPPCI